MAHLFEYCRCGIASCELMNRAPNLASAADDITVLIICEVVCTAPLLDKNSSFSDKKICPPAWLCAFDSERYDASLCAANIMPLAQYVMMASWFEDA